MESNVSELVEAMRSLGAGSLAVEIAFERVLVAAASSPLTLDWNEGLRLNGSPIPCQRMSAFRMLLALAGSKLLGADGLPELYGGKGVIMANNIQFRMVVVNTTGAQSLFLERASENAEKK